jgi:sRNA-binding carbon storage regulator CsrA
VIGGNMMMKKAMMMLSALYVKIISIMGNLVKLGFSARNVEGSTIQFAVETAQIVI